MGITGRRAIAGEHIALLKMAAAVSSYLDHERLVAGSPFTQKLVPGAERVPWKPSAMALTVSEAGTVSWQSCR